MDHDERLRLLFESHAAQVYAYTARQVDAATAQDIVSEVFLTAWQRRDVLPVEPLPWLRVVARNKVANLRRANTRQHNLVVELAALEHVSAQAAPFDAGEDAKAAVAALRRLTPQQREAVLLVAWDGLPIRDAARVAGCSRGTFDVRLHRARARLRSAWTTTPDEDEFVAPEPEGLSS